MGKKEHKQNNNRNLMEARLSFNEGQRERPIHSIRAMTTEKDKGIDMIDLIQQHFGVTIEDVRNKFISRVREFSSIGGDKKKLCRDEDGNLISPFSNKAKELKRKGL